MLTPWPVGTFSWKASVLGARLWDLGTKEGFGVGGSRSLTSVFLVTWYECIVHIWRLPEIDRGPTGHIKIGILQSIGV